MLFPREKNPDTALRIKEVEQNIWRHTISSAVAARPLKPNLPNVLAFAKKEREGQRGRGGNGLLLKEGSGRLKLWLVTAKRRIWADEEVDT